MNFLFNLILIADGNNFLVQDFKNREKCLFKLESGNTDVKWLKYSNYWLFIVYADIFLFLRRICRMLFPG